MIGSDITCEVFEFGFYFSIGIYMKGFWKVSFEMVIVNDNVDCLAKNIHLMQKRKIKNDTILMYKNRIK